MVNKESQGREEPIASDPESQVSANTDQGRVMSLSLMFVNSKSNIKIFNYSGVESQNVD